FRLHVVETGEDQAQGLGGVRARLEDRGGRQSFRLPCPGQYRWGQGPVLSLYRGCRLPASCGNTIHVGTVFSIVQTAAATARRLTLSSCRRGCAARSRTATTSGRSGTPRRAARHPAAPVPPARATGAWRAPAP